MHPAPELVPLISKKRIDARVSEVAAKISSDYGCRDLVLIGILKGAFIFLADLARALSIPHRIEFIRAASYGAATVTSGKISLSSTSGLDLQHKDVLLVEDIVDTGLTLSHLITHLQTLEPASLKICALIDKAERREISITVDYACFRIDEGFLVGYGLDYNEDYRQLPALYHLKL